MRSAKSMATTENHTSVKEVRHSEVLALMLSVVAVILRMVVRVRRAVRSGRNVSGWQGTRKLSMRVLWLRYCSTTVSNNRECSVYVLSTTVSVVYTCSQQP
mgnify:CR=1 FL=1